MVRKVTLWLLALSFLASPVLAASSRWLHILVEEKRDGTEAIRLNLPIKMVLGILPHIRADSFQGGLIRIDLDDGEVDLRGILEAVRDAEEGEFVTIEEDDGTVRARKTGNVLSLRIEEGGSSPEQVDITLGLHVLEALVGAEDGTLDLAAALEALDAHQTGDLVTVRSDEGTIRIWVDDRDSTDGKDWR